jgi:RNA polymerase sigma factor (sigma-70 family)
MLEPVQVGHPKLREKQPTRRVPPRKKNPRGGKKGATQKPGMVIINKCPIFNACWDNRKMADPNDMDLVREYADRHSEPAFAELVHRHINLVHSVALRFTGHPQDAEDVTQAVFVILARKAQGLRAKTIVTGWLYETTRFTAKRFLRTQVSRQLREQEASMSTTNDSASESVWRQLAPLLEEAMASLSEKERTLVALRFFENKSAAETAALLGIQEWAARKRVDRALERLRRWFTRRGVALTTATIAGAISLNSVQAAPASLAKTATAVALAKGASAPASTLTLVKGALKIMAWSKAKTAIVIGAVVFLATGTTTLVVVKAQTAVNQRNSLAAEIGVMREGVFQAVMLFAKDHQDEIPKRMADLKPYLPANVSGVDDDHWRLSATGKMTPLLTRGDVILIEQQHVPPGRKLLILFTDGHVERKKAE